ncbi:MAG: tol-pal system protein YbgF [Proteobacteria bacterium]|nr:tol-pal system protein YbgF [Pseudomonadota bacterium]
MRSSTDSPALVSIRPPLTGGQLTGTMLQHPMVVLHPLPRYLFDSLPHRLLSCLSATLPVLLRAIPFQWSPGAGGVAMAVGMALTCMTAPLSFAQTAAPRQSPIRVEESVPTSTLNPPARVSAESSMVAPATNPGAPVTSTLPPPTEEQALGNVESQFQLQILSDEVRMLRGQVEELSHRLQRMQATQEDRYLELDARFQALDASIDSSVAKAPVSRDPLVRPVAPSQTGVVIEGDEKTRYETALDLIRKRQYDLAISQLRGLINQYPDGEYTANAYYWLGEVYIAKPKPGLEDARQAFSQVIEFFPDNRKVPDAAFKLGKVYHQMGDCVRAREMLTEVARKHAGRSAATLAETYLREKLVDCET